ncbi:MAG TPA: SRPBCC domain-containing protein [Burkholderiales bacterium]|nr:SRPBCC domain-containing protein [Burkholderiales bacterium]
MDTAPYIEVRVAQRFSVPPEQVFDAWVDPAAAGKWLFATAWRPMSRVAIDARAGGTFRLEERPGGKGVVQAGRYLEFDRPRRLVFTLLDGNGRRDTPRVSVGIVALEAGCELTLVHEGVLPPDANRVEGRWLGMLHGLATLLER